VSLRAKLARMTPPPAALRPGAPPAAAGPRPPAADPAGAGGDGGARADLDVRTNDETHGARPAAGGRAFLAPAEFERVDTPEGPLYRRVVRLPASHLVGRGALAPARRACARGLARLAFDPALAPLDAASFLYVDTETTGLAGGTGTIAFLIGLAGCDGEGWALEQLLVPEPGDEAPALARASAAVAAAGAVVTYNGKSFDLPLLRARVALNRLPPLASRPHLDLMHVARRLHGRRLGRCPLRAVEGDVLGFARPTSIASADVVGRYRAFLRSGEGALLDEVVAHNAADVLSLVALVGLYDDPLGALGPVDLVALARTWTRAGAPEAALEALARAREGGGARDAGPAAGAPEAEALAGGAGPAGAPEAEALAGGAGPAGAPEAEALAVGADVARALGDDVAAADALSALLTRCDDGAVRLRLAKLYEHRLGRPDEALRLVERGTGELAPALERRRRRLERKIARPAQPPLPGFEALVAPAPRRPRRPGGSVLALRQGEQGGNLRLNRLELADGELNLGLAQPPRGVDEVE
jgi:hypothetical protein